MADEPTDETEAEQAEVEAPLAGEQEAEAEEQSGDKPFDAESAHRTIRKLRDQLRAAKSDRTPQAEKDARLIAALKKQLNNTEEKATSAEEMSSRIEALEAEKLRIRIGYRHGLPDELIDRLQGTTEEEILADAEKLLGAITAGKKPSPTQRPKEALRGGSKPDEEPEETDPRKLAALVPRR
jgi:small-conductance mechanosensitive channel